MNALKQRAQAVLNDESLDEQSRATLRHALETNDPWLAELVRREDAGETNEADSGRKIEALAEMICGAGNESAAAYETRNKDLPAFRSVDELVAFFETHDMSEYWENLPEVEFEISLKKKVSISTFRKRCKNKSYNEGRFA